VNRLCASGLEAIHVAARMIESGQGDVYVAGGVESMSRAPYVLSKSEQAFGRAQELVDTTIGWRFVNPRLAAKHPPISLGETAENVARAHGVSRDDQDRFALASQERWAAAHAAGRFADELAPVDVPQGKGATKRFDVDEHPRPDTTMAKLAALKPAFSKAADATVTAGNSSGINDGAAALLLVESSRAKALGLVPLAYVGAGASAGVDPAHMGIGPVPAVRKLAGRTGIDPASIDLVELNEAFAAQAVACVRGLGLDPARVNVNGGAIAIGHPLGASGARITVTLVHEMVRRGARRGLASLCVGVGQGLAVMFERE
jgi:acetyl-CoA acetyltransferase family protein